MWDQTLLQFNSLAKAVSKQAADAVKEAGLDATLKNINDAAKSQLNTIANSVLEIEPAAVGEAPKSPLKAAVSKSNGGPASASPFHQEAVATPQKDHSNAAAHSDDGFQDISLDDGERQGSGLKTAGSPLRHAQFPSNSDGALVQENAQLKRRLVAVEEAAAEALGELEDLREQLSAESASRNIAVAALHAKEVENRSEISQQRSGWEREAARSAEKYHDELEAVQNELKASQEGLAAAQEATKSMETRGRKAAKAAKEYQAQLGVLKPKLEDTSSECERLRAELEQLLLQQVAAGERHSEGWDRSVEVELQESVAECERLRTELAQQQQVAAAERQSKGRDSSAEESVAECLRLREELVQLQALAAKRDATISSLEEEVDSYSSECDGLRASFAALHQQSAAQVARFEEEIGLYSSERSALRESLTQLQEQLRGIQAEGSEKLGNSQAEGGEVASVGAAGAASLLSEEAACQLSELELKLASATERAAVAEGGLEQLSSQCHSLSSDLGASNDLILRLRAEAEALHRVSDLTQQLLCCLTQVEATDGLPNISQEMLELGAQLIDLHSIGTHQHGHDQRQAHGTKQPNGDQNQQNGCALLSGGFSSGQTQSRGESRDESAGGVHSLAAAEAALETSETHAKLLETRLAKEKEAVKRLTAELQQMRSHAEHASSSAVRSDDHALRQTVLDLECVVASVESTKASLQHKVTELEAMVASLESATAALEQKVAELEALVASTDSAKAALQQTVAELETMVSALAPAKASLEETVTELEARVASLESDKATLEQSLVESLGVASDRERLLGELKAAEKLWAGEKEAVEKLGAAEKEAAQQKAAKVEGGRQAVLKRVAELETANEQYKQQLAVQSKQLGSGNEQVASLSGSMAAKEKERVAALAQVVQLQHAVADTEAAAAALREASQMELSLVSGKLLDVQKQAAESAKRVRDLEKAVGEAEAGHHKKLSQLEDEVTRLRSQAAQSEAQLAVLRDSLTAERDASKAALMMAKAEFEANLDAELANAGHESQGQLQQKLEELRSSAAVREAEVREEMQALKAELASAQTEAIRLKSMVSDMDMLRAQVQQFGPMTTKMTEDLSKARADASTARESHRVLEESVRRMEAEASERSRKFAMLLRGFRSSEEALKEQLALVTSQIDAHVATAGAAKAEVEEAKAGAHVSLREQERLEEKLTDLQAAMARMETQLRAQVDAFAECSGKLASAEAELQQERAARKAADSDDGALRQDFDRLVSAAIAAKEDEAERRVAAAQEELELAQEAVRDAEARAEVAERAKIDLTLALAQVDDDARAANSSEGLHRSIDTHRNSNAALGAEDMQHAMEEAELAAAVQTRRASKAEEELSSVKAQLTEAQKQVKDLSWQIRMTMGSGEATTIGGKGATGVRGASGASAYLDILGCGANSVRKK